MDKDGKRKQTRCENIKDAYLQETKKRNLILHLSMSSYEIDKHCLQAGVQPKGIFKVVIHRRGEF